MPTSHFGPGPLGSAILSAALLISPGKPAEASLLLAGDHISFIGIEGGSPNPNPGAAYPVDLTVGPVSGNGELFNIVQLTVFNAAGQCISCGWQLNLSNLFISQGATDLVLSGDLSGTLRSGIDFDVAFSPSSESWTYQAQGGNPITGIVDAPAVVPEPASLAVFGTALAGLGLLGRRRRKHI